MSDEIEKVVLKQNNESGRRIVVTDDSIKSGQCVPHAWNIVDIDGEPYQLDVTWNIGTVKFVGFMLMMN